MNKVSVIKDINTKSIYGAVVHDDHLKAVAIPVAIDSIEWAAWLNDSRASFHDVKSVLDTNLQQELSVDIDRHLVKSVEQEFGPELARKIELFIPGDKFIQDGKSHPTMGTSIVRKSLTKVPRTNLYSTPLNQINVKDRQAALNFKARRFRTEQKVTALNIQVKRVRAVFDANIGPGGGWRCPDGTLNGGQITDRFGRGCGGGLTRRIGRALMQAGQRLDEAGQARDSRRLARRVERATRRGERADRMREGRTRVANRLDAAADRLVGDFAPARPAGERRPSRTPSARRIEPRPTTPVPGGRRPQQGGRETPTIPGTEPRGLGVEILPGGERGRSWADMTDDELEAALQRNEPRKPPTDGTIGFLPESEAEVRRKRANQAAIRAEQERRRGGDGQEPEAAEAEAAPADGATPGRRPGRRPSQQRPVRPRRPQGERRPTPDADADRPAPSDSGDPFDFIEDPEERERVKEALGPWAKVLADLIRERRREEGRDGAPRPRRERRGAERGQESEEQRSLMQKIMDFFAQAIQRLGEFRERRGESRERRRARRDERRQRIADALDDAASRVLQEEGVPKRRRRGPARGGRRTDVNARARDAAERVVPDDDERSRWRNEVNKQWREERGIPEDLKELKDNELDAILEVVQNEENDFQANPDTFDMFVDERRRNLRRLNGEKRRRARASREEQPAPAAADGRQTPEAPAAPDSADLEGSVPDERSLRNVRNRFPRRGLPATAYWRDRDRPGYNKSNAQEMDRRFGRYYDRNGNINARGRYVNDRLRDEREANRRPLDADERERIETDANRNFDIENPDQAEAPGTANAPEAAPSRPGQLDELSDDEIFERLKRYRYNQDEPFNMAELRDDEVGRLQDIIDRNPDAFQEQDRSDGRRDVHPAFRLVGGEFNIRQNGGRDDQRAATPEANVPPARPQFDTPEQRREFVDRALADNPQQPEDFGEIVRMWKDAGNVAALEDAFNRYQARERALDRAEAQLRFAGHNTEADELRERRQTIGIARRQSLFALQSLNPEWGIEEVLNPPNERNADAPEFGPGSEPDERSFRNVFNAFRQRGLPAKPTWRDRNRRNYSETRERDFDRRFGRYYDANGDLNERGKYVNRKLREKREAEGRPLNEGEVAQVVVREEMENQERELASPAPVPDAAPAAAPGTPVNPSDPPDEALLQEARSGELARRMRERVQALKEASPGTATPEDIGELVADIDRINRSLRQIRAQWIAGKNNGMQQQDLRNLERDHSALMMARNNAIPGFNRPFSSNDDTVVFVGDVGYVDGIFHEKFDGEREEFLRAHFAIFAGINDIIDESDGNDSQALSDVLNFVDAEWANNGGRMSPQEFASLMMKGGGWEGKSPAERSEIIRYAAAAAIDLDALDKAMIRKTGMTVDQARELKREREFITAQAARMSTLRNQLNQRVVPGDLAPNVPDRVNELQAMATRYLDAVQHVRGIKRSIDARDDVPDEARAFAARLGRTMGGQPWPNTTGQQDIFSSDFAYLDTARPQEHINFVAAKLNDLMTGTSGGPADDEARIRQLQAIKADGVLRTLPQWRNTVLSGGVIGDNLGELVALAITRNNLTQTQIDMRIADLRRRSNLPTPPNANLGAQRNNNEPNGRANNVFDAIEADPEAIAQIDQVLENAQRKRRRVLTSVFRKKYPNDAGSPWDNFKRRNNGEHPINPDTFTQDYRNATPEKKRAMKAWVKNLYEIEVDGPQGTSARTVVDRIEFAHGVISVRGHVEATLADGRKVSSGIGQFTREIRAGGHVYSAYFAVGANDVGNAASLDIDLITGERVRKSGDKWIRPDGSELPADHHILKGMGLANSFNGHSWGWLKDAGFKTIGVTAAADGPYVWGRVGYRPESSGGVERMWRNAMLQVNEFRAGNPSVVTSETQARMISQLAKRASDAQFVPRNSPAQMELIYALEHGMDDSNRRARTAEVRSYLIRSAPIGSGTVYLEAQSFDAIDESNDPRDVQLNRRGVGTFGGSMVRGLVRPQDADVRRGQIATPVVAPGDLPEPRVITNPSVKSPEQAVNFLRNGGSLNDIPNEYWIAAIEGNASTNQNDPNALFFARPPRDGNRGDTRIYQLRDAQGNPINQGIVIKGSVPYSVGNGVMDDVYSEIAGYNLAAAAGLLPEGAGYVGTATLNPRAGRGRGQEEVMIVIPHALNLAPGDGEMRAGRADYDPTLFNGLPDKGLPARTAHFFHNFFVGAADRHNKNGGTFVDQNGNAVVVPYDQGRIAVPALGATYRSLAGDATVGAYVGKFRMDGALFADMQAHIRTLSRQEATRFRQEMLDRYDDMVSRYRSVIAGGRDEFIRKMSIGAPDTVGGRNVRAMREQRFGEIYDHLKQKVDNAAAHRTYLKTKLAIPRGA